MGTERLHAVRVVRRACPGAAAALALAWLSGGVGAQDEPQPEQTQLSEPAPPRIASRGDDERPEAIVILRDGRRVSGLLVDEHADGAVTLSIAGIETTFEAGRVSEVQILPSVRERYRMLREPIPDTDAERLLLLVEWLRDREEYELALLEAQTVLEHEPDHPKAIRLEREVRAALALRELRRQPREDLHGNGADASGTREFPVLGPSQINLIKVFEIDLARPPKIEISRETRDRLIERYSESDVVPQTPEGRQALYRKPDVDILDRMFRVQARDLYPEVKVTGDPYAFGLFRKNVHAAWLVTSCATTQCHGGEAAGNLMLNNARRASEATVYTNFLILDRFRLADGETPLINYADPASSPLLQMALPRERSQYPHPEVAGGPVSTWRPVFRTTDDPRFTRAVEWIRAMYTPRPEYPVEYVPPTPGDDGAPLPPVEGRRPR